MEYRKLIAFGKSSFVVSLPKAWVIKQKLQKGDTLYFKEQDGSLVLSPKEKESALEEKEGIINIDGKNIRRIQRELFTSYIKNYKKITFVGNDIKEKAKLIQNSIQKLVAVEIIEQDSKKIIAKDFLNIDDINIDQLVRKMDVIAKSMLEDCRNMFEEDTCENINFRDNDVNKFHFLIFRIVWFGLENPSLVMKKFNLNSNNLLNLWWLAYSIERIADCTKRIARYMQRTKLDQKSQQEFKEILASVGADYIGMMKGYYAKDPEIVHQLLQNREETVKRCDTFFLQNKEAPFIGYLMDNTKALLVNTHAIGRMIYQGIPE
ncbi:phosphate uptake regulator PhoU [Candidatus Woesearchaeota archaeon]|nr:phosphate uptake regulator PhoU [Candidatus Woesearchaeota archaeon]